MSLIQDIKPLTSTPQTADSCKLSILLGVDSLIYGLWAAGEWLAFRQMMPGALQDRRQWPAVLTKWLEEEDFWGVQPSAVRIGFGNTRFTLLPKRLFSLQHKRSYLEKLVPLNPQDLLQADMIEWLGSVLVYAIDHSLLERLSARFPIAAFTHFGSALLRRQRRRREEGPHIQLCVLERMLYFTAISYEHLHFFNAFPWQDTNDVLYYTALVFEQAGFDRTTSPLYLCGMLEKDAKFVRSLQPWFPKLSWEEPDHKAFALDVL